MSSKIDFGPELNPESLSGLVILLNIENTNIPITKQDREIHSLCPFTSTTYDTTSSRVRIVDGDMVSNGNCGGSSITVSRPAIVPGSRGGAWSTSDVSTSGCSGGWTTSASGGRFIGICNTQKNISIAFINQNCLMGAPPRNPSVMASHLMSYAIPGLNSQHDSRYYYTAQNTHCRQPEASPQARSL